MLISCPHHHFITNVKIHSFKVHIKGFCVNSNSMNLLLFVINNRNGSTYIGTVHQNFQSFDISRGLRDPAQFHVNLSCKLFVYWWRLMTFKRDVTMVWWTGSDSLVVTKVSNFKYVLRINYRYLFYMKLSILWPANISKKSFGCN